MPPVLVSPYGARVVQVSGGLCGAGHRMTGHAIEDGKAWWCREHAPEALVAYFEDVVGRYEGGRDRTQPSYSALDPAYGMGGVLRGMVHR